MFTRFLQFEIKNDKQNEFLKFTKNEIIPILKKQPGFVELLPFFPENWDDKKVYTFSLWNKKSDAERFEREWYPKVLDMMTPYLAYKPIVRYYELESSLLCKEFAHTVAA
jgi:hypothetical protein